MKVLFDVDETLILNKYRIGEDIDVPNEPVIAVLCALAAAGHEIYVSSGGGVDYAQSWCRRLGIDDIVKEVLPKDYKLLESYHFQMSFDDMPTNFAAVNFQVYRGGEKPDIGIL